MASLVDEFLERTRAAAEAVAAAPSTGTPERDFRLQVEAFLPALFSDWGITFLPSMERATVTQRRIDMLCGRLVTEYKAPGILASDSDYASALTQTQDYLEQLAAEFGEPVSEYFGIVLDGFYVGFIHYDADEGWLRSVRSPMDKDAALQVVSRFRAHSKHPLDAGKISEAMGPKGAAAGALMPALVAALEQPTGKTALLFAEWRRLFGQAVGTEAHQYPGVVDWAAGMGVDIDGRDPEQLARLFFATHTYFALVIKILTADVVATIRSHSLARFAQGLVDADAAGRHLLLTSLESNELFERHGIQGFLEGDFFSWYLDHYSDSLDVGIAALAGSASSFEPATPMLSPSRVTDLFKKLYQHLVPERIRHDLGEFYTPDWLADYTLQRAGFPVNPTGRLLDPTCGSGTFLVRAIRALKRAQREDPSLLGDDGLLGHVNARNLAGFDLNPLAVISARANLVVALLDELSLNPELGVRLPVYLADSIYSPEAVGGNFVYRLQTERGLVEMKFSESLVRSDHFDSVLREVEGFMFGSDKPHPDALPADSLVVQHGLQAFYAQIWALDEQDWNKIWCRVIHNRFAAVQVGQFDFVIGNPPWVVWSSLPGGYREAVKHVCERYDIFSDDGWVGGIESDISTVVTYSAADRWLKQGGTMGFVITQSVFKTKSAQGFRAFKLPDGTGLQVTHVDDMVAIRPFDDAANRTAVMVLKKGKPSTWPVPYVVWKRRSRNHRFKTSDSLAQVMRKVNLWAHEAAPTDAAGGAWITAPVGRLQALLGLLGKKGDGIHARKGITTDFNNIYWVTPQSRAGQVVTVENNLSTLGHQVPKTSFPVEEGMLFPLARGREIKRFQVQDPAVATLLPQRGMRSFDAAQMAAKGPLTLAYLQQFEHTACIGCRVGTTCVRGLRDRGSYKNPKYQKAMGDYWSVWNVGAYTFSPYKVAWKEVSSRFEAAVLSTATLAPLDEKAHVPDHKLMFKPCQTADEAHYYCAVLNSGLIRSFAEAVSLSTSRGTRIFEQLKIPDFDASDAAHLRLASLSQAAHSGRLQDDGFESELDVAVAAALGHQKGQLQLLPTVSTWSDPLTTALRASLSIEAGRQFPGSEQPLEDVTFVAFDFETTGFSPGGFADRAVEVGAVRFTLAGHQESFQATLWPGRPIAPAARKVHGISLEDLAEAPTFSELWPELESFLKGAVLVGHNVAFDLGFLQAHLGDAGLTFQGLALDTLGLLRSQFSLGSNRLGDALTALGAEGDATHAALADAGATAQLLLRLIEVLRSRGTVGTLGDLAALQSEDPAFSFVSPRPRDALDGLVASRAKVAWPYGRDGAPLSEIRGKVIDRCTGTERSYVTVEVAGGRRLTLREDRVRT